MENVLGNDSSLFGSTEDSNIESLEVFNYDSVYSQVEQLVMDNIAGSSARATGEINATAITPSHASTKVIFIYNISGPANLFNVFYFSRISVLID